MKNVKVLFVALAATGVLAGCGGIDPRDFETEPVELQTAKGTVTCQLYTPQRVVWDRAIDWPRSMNAREADAVCQAEGQRQKDALRS